eukprot:320580-Prymnesium_polylepis.1
MYTVLDLLAGPRAHRQLNNFTDVKLPQFTNERAIARSWVWDQDNMTRAYHGAQLFTVDLVTGEHRFHMPHNELCGLSDTYQVFSPGRMRQWHEPVRESRPSRRCRDAGRAYGPPPTRQHATAARARTASQSIASQCAVLPPPPSPPPLAPAPPVHTRDRP